MSYAVYRNDNLTSASAAGDPSAAVVPAAAMLDDIQNRVANAVQIAPARVKVEGFQTGFAGWIRRCWGEIEGARFFAKIFLVDPFPIPPRFPLPAEELDAHLAPQRPVEEQIAAEWKKIHEVQSWVGTPNIPSPLGFSFHDRILVFKEVSGLRMDRLVKRLWLHPRQGKSVEKAMFLAGRWLRTLHDASLQGFTSVDFGEVINGLRGLLRRRHLEHLAHGEVAVKTLEGARAHLAPGAPIRVPVALSHGDFALANLLWQQDQQHLWVVDFELSSPGAVFRDLGMMIFDLRRLLIYPFVSQASIRRWEEAFWRGYGDIPEDLFVFIQAVATARIFYDTLSRIRTWRAQRGLLAGIKASLYTTLFEPIAVRRILGLSCKPAATGNALRTDVTAPPENS